MPSVLFLIDFIPYYASPLAYKIQQASTDAAGLNTAWNQFSQDWLGIGYLIVPARILQSTIYWVIQLRMVAKSGKIEGGKKLLSENRNIMSWIKILCTSQFLFFFPYYLNAFFGNRESLFFVGHTMLAISISITVLILMIRPDILYGLKGILLNSIKYSEDPVINASLTEITRVIKPESEIVHIHIKTVEQEALNEIEPDVYVSGQNLAELGKKLTAHLKKEKPFLKKGCTCAALAGQMTVQPYILSAVINQIFKTNFNDFINRYRVEHAKQLISNGEAKLLTLEALSEQCGFNNRNSFTGAFKKHAGKTPSEFIKDSAEVIN